MTSAKTSEYTGFIRGLAGELVESGPLDTAIVRDGIVNNLNHLTDMAGQVVCQFVSPTTAYSLTSPSTTVFTRFDTLPSFAFPLRIRNDGSSYRYIIDARCSISAAGTATFRFWLRLPGGPGVGYPPDPASYPQTIDASTTSTTGADVGPKTVRAGASMVAAALGRGVDRGYVTEGLSLDGDGVVAAAPYILARVEVWAASSVTTSLPQIQSLIVREYIGAV